MLATTTESGQTKVFMAIRDIAHGEEIVVNYNGEPGDKTPVWFKVLETEPSQKQPENRHWIYWDRFVDS